MKMARPDILGALEDASLAVHEGIMLPAHRRVSHLLLQHGHAVPIDDSVKEKREQLGMKALPETVHRCPDALLDVQTLLKSCGFDRLTDDG